MQAKFEPNASTDLAIVDLGHLLEFASGDALLAARFLRLFLNQSTRDLNQLAASADAETWFDAAHSLQSSASGIGAWRLVEVSERAQNQDNRITDALRKQYFDVLTMRVIEVAAFINDYLEQD